MENYKRNEKGVLDIKIEELYVYEGLVGEGCIASNKITKDGNHVGYMYRDELSEAYPDSGWCSLREMKVRNTVVSPRTLIY